MSNNNYSGWFTENVESLAVGAVVGALAGYFISDYYAKKAAEESCKATLQALKEMSEEYDHKFSEQARVFNEQIHILEKSLNEGA